MGLTSNSILPLEIMNLYVIFRYKSYSKMILVKIIIMDIPSAYNTIIKRSILNRLWVMVSTYHMVTKFLTSTSIGW